MELLCSSGKEGGGRGGWSVEEIRRSGIREAKSWKPRVIRGHEDHSGRGFRGAKATQPSIDVERKEEPGMCVEEEGC
jgi:hypothetical protein